MSIIYKRGYISRRALQILTILLILGTGISQAQPDGKNLFKTTCATCHTIGKGKLTGPDLKGVFERVPSRDWMVKWIQNSPAVIASGDPYANKIYEEFNQTEMPPQPLTEEEVNAVLDYIKVAEVEAEKKQVDAGPAGGAVQEDKGEDNTLFYILLFAAAILLLITWSLRSIKNALHDVAAEKLGIPERDRLGVLGGFKKWAGNNKRVVALGVIVLLSYGFKEAWYGVLYIGVHQGYEPEQPIAFPHDLHAGKNGIDCAYCHFGAEKGKTAGIPPLTVCMNCHANPQLSGSRTGKEEINKIFDYLDYDPETMSYGDNPKPIEWVRVHNLPDLAYFNHSQHVKVGGIACQTCHGPVEKMAVLRQESMLTMGWCVDCHRKTKVKMEGNPYYDDIHSKLSEEHLQKFMEDGKITVEELGGTECARCHY